MKKWTDKTKATIQCDKGETLIETIVSIIIFAIFMLAISMMISTSLKLTSVSTQNTNHMQEEIINPVMMYEYNDSTNVNISFSNSVFGISTSHTTRLNDKDGIVAFTPGVGP